MSFFHNYVRFVGCILFLCFVANAQLAIGHARDTFWNGASLQMVFDWVSF